MSRSMSLARSASGRLRTSASRTSIGMVISHLACGKHATGGRPRGWRRTPRTGWRGTQQAIRCEGHHNV
jgi:hypothetical protein